MKKVISFLLVLIFVAQVLPLSVFASDNNAGSNSGSAITFEENEKIDLGESSQPKLTTFASAKFVDHANWVETNTTEIRKMHDNNQKFIVVYYRKTCGISLGMRSVYKRWLTDYKFTLYGVDIDKSSAPGWIWSNWANGQGGSQYFPFTVLVNKKNVVSYAGTDGNVIIRQAVEKHLGLQQTGWVGSQYFHGDGTPAKGWTKLVGSWYYFDNTGTITTGWKQIDSKWYYLAEKGNMITGTIKIGNETHHFDANGIWTGDVVTKTGWQQSGSTWQYYNTSGQLTKGWASIGGSWYYFNTSGTMQTGWQQIGGTWYYMHASGAMATGTIKIGNETHNFNASGVWLGAVASVKTGWQQSGSTWQYYNTSGQLTKGWASIGGSWYYFNTSGTMQTGWQQIGGSWYYFNTSGTMQTGWQQIAGTWYYLSSGGNMATGTLKIGNETHNFNASGVWLGAVASVKTGWQQSGSVWQYYTSSGQLTKGWASIGGSWYYFNTSGTMQTGWQQIAGTWYYLSSGGNMATGTIKIGNETHNFNASGVWLGAATNAKSGWLKEGSSWYYYVSGVRQTGWQEIGGSWYYLGIYGNMAAGGSITIAGKIHTFDANGVWLGNTMSKYHKEKAQEVFRLVNLERQKIGLHTLSWNEALYEPSNIRAKETTVLFSHTRPDGSEWYTVSDLANGENIAAYQQTPAVVMTSWMNSPGHKMNILHSEFNSMAVGCYEFEGRLYWVQLFSIS